MGTESDHREKAQHNQEFFNTIDINRFPDWAVTVSFYQALHTTEMLFARCGKHSNNHRERHDVLKREHPDIWMHYLPLYAQSRRARYKVKTISAETVRYCNGRLAKVEAIIHERLKSMS